MGDRGKDRQSSFSPSRRTLPSLLGPFILEEESPPPSITPVSPADMPAVPGHAPTVPVAVPAIPGPALGPAPAANGLLGGANGLLSARLDRAERIKGFLTRLKGSQSQAQFPRPKKSQVAYGPVLPLTEDLLTRLKGANSKPPMLPLYFYTCSLPLS
jgi:hypothetical protein